MKYTFYKYQGTGNDFVMIDNRQNIFDKNDTKLIAHLCDRRFGIGADGLILLENDEETDFKMVYFNADGKEGSMCGNGGRCIVAFAKQLNIIKRETIFDAIDGRHEASIENQLVQLKMGDVEHINFFKEHTFLDTGSPHHVIFSPDVNAIDVLKTGAKIRYGAPYHAKGTNVNFAQQVDNNTFKVRTYERGVENETLACGTGVTAVALAAHATNRTKEVEILLQVEGGELEVSFSKLNDRYTDIYLKGPATFVYNGVIEDS